MRHEKIIKRPDGRKIRIAVTFYVGVRDEVNYNLDVLLCEAGKRTFRRVVDTDDYQWRALSMPDREKANMQKYLEVATKEEILEAKMELWQMLKPE